MSGVETEISFQDGKVFLLKKESVDLSFFNNLSNIVNKNFEIISLEPKIDVDVSHG